MGAMVTQTRPTPGFRTDEVNRFLSPNLAEPFITAAHTRNVAGGFPQSLWRIPLQTTTSFRSGRPGPVSSEDYVIPDDYQEFFQMLNRERLGVGRSHQYGDLGHEFSTVKESMEKSMVALRNETGEIRYEGFLEPHYHPSLMPSGLGGDVYADVPEPAMAHYGTLAFNRTAPTNPLMSLSTTLAELKREGLPSAPIGLNNLSGTGGKRGRARKSDTPVSKAGSEYLNYEFGYKPLANDAAKLLYIATEASRLLKQYQRDSGRVVRRRHVFPETVETNTVTRKVSGYGNSVGQMAPDGYGWVGDINVGGRTVRGLWDSTEQTITETFTTRRRYWFSGAFSYYLQPDSAVLNKLHRSASEIQHLFGMRVDAGTVWNLTPWSWLLDWVANIGVNIENAELLATDGLVMRYGYIMCHTTQAHTVTAHGLRTSSGQDVGVQRTWTRESKARTQASPFGFALNPENFSGRQKAILAALGMTKAPRQTWS